MALDACVVRHISRDIKHRVRGIDVHGGDAAPFRFSEFATRVAGAMNTERDNDGDESAGIFKTVPSRYGDFFLFLEHVMMTVQVGPPARRPYVDISSVPH